jgi:hypothetical protein
MSLVDHAADAGDGDTEIVTPDGSAGQVGDGATTCQQNADIAGGAADCLDQASAIPSF